MKLLLKPCPFCGSHDLEEKANSASEIHGALFQSAWIECLNCGTSGPVAEITDSTFQSDFLCNTFKDYDGVRKLWNTRHN